MAQVTVVCDRCRNFVQGIRTKEATGGFYDVTGAPWSKFARPGEKVICDPCMFKDPAYIAGHGARS